MASTVMGIYESKFVVLKHFGCDVSAKESSSPFLFTIYTLKSVFCKDNSVEYAFDRCVEFLSGNTAGDDRNTHWKHVLKVHCDQAVRLNLPSIVTVILVPRALRELATR